MKPRIFVGSSGEKLYLAEAIQRNLERRAVVTIWNQGVFGPSDYPLEALERAATASDAGVFVFAPDDLTRMRGSSSRTVRDNVLFEAGLFIGALGRKRTFLVAPRKFKFHLPSDLGAITVLEYDGRRPDKRWDAALGSACSQISEAASAFIRETKAKRSSLQAEHLGFFEDFYSTFEEILPKARRVTTFFIHSRRWRENNIKAFPQLLRRPSGRLTVYLPDPNDAVLSDTFLRNFDDGPHIPEFIRDAIRFFAHLKKQHRNKVTIRLYKNYPTYSFYVVDGTVILAMYPTTSHRRSVPALRVTLNSPIGEFVRTDLKRLEDESRRPTAAELKSLIGPRSRRRSKKR